MLIVERREYRVVLVSKAMVSTGGVRASKGYRLNITILSSFVGWWLRDVRITPESRE